MHITANIFQAKTQLSKLIEQALAGQDVVIAKAGKPVVRLVAYQPEKKLVTPGSLKGKITISKDFTAESDEVNELFYGVSRS